MSRIVEVIRKQIAENPVILYMKGTPEAPQCGFSAKATACLQSTGVEFAYVNVLEAPLIRERLKEVSNWPTFPQLFVQGELVGGADIIIELTEKGELAETLRPGAASHAG